MALALSRDPLRLLTRLQRDHGDVVRFSIGRYPIHLVSDPELIREVLVNRAQEFGKGRALQRAKTLLGEGLLTSEGTFHARQRRLVQPAFHSEHFRSYGMIMSEEAERLAGEWRAGQQINIAREMSDLTLMIVTRTLFGGECGRHEASLVHEALTTSLSLFPLSYLPFSHLLERLPLPATQRFRRAKQQLDATIYSLIAQRRASPDASRRDVLSLLLSAQDAEGNGEGMSDEQVRDEAMILFLAGHETTANALAWTWYLLGQHRDVEERVLREIDELSAGGRALGFDDVPRLPYTRRVLMESMRLFPPAWALGRRALFDIDLGGWQVPRDSVVLMSQWVVHRSERYYPDPERFDPDRWLPEAVATRPKFSYFPFGAGPRVCIGEHFAMAEMVIVLGTLLRRWSFRPAAQAKPPQPWPTVTLRPKPGVWVEVVPRD